MRHDDDCRPADDLISLLFDVVMMMMMTQSLTYRRYREFPVPGISHFVGGIGTGIGTNWYRKKVSEPVSEKFGPEKVPEPVSENLVPEKSLGTGIGKI